VAITIRAASRSTRHLVRIAAATALFALAVTAFATSANCQPIRPAEGGSESQSSARLAIAREVERARGGFRSARPADIVALRAALHDTAAKWLSRVRSRAPTSTLRNDLSDRCERSTEASRPVSDELRFWTLSRTRTAHAISQLGDPRDGELAYQHLRAIDRFIGALKSQQPSGPRLHAASIAELAAIFRVDGPPLKSRQRRRVGEIVDRLQRGGQSQRLTNALADAFSKPNVIVRIPSQALANLELRKIDREFSISRRVNGANVRGRGKLEAMPQFRLRDDERRIAINLQIAGKATADTAARRSRVHVETSGTSSFTAATAIYFDGRELTVEPFRSSAQLQLEIERVLSQSLLAVRRRRAFQVVYSRHEEDRLAAERNTEQQLNEAFDRDVGIAVGSLQSQFDSAVVRPLLCSGVWPATTSCRVSEGVGIWRLHLSAPHQLSAPTAPPPSDDGAIQFQVHESAWNNYAAVMAGVKTELGSALRRFAAATPADAQPGSGEVVIRFADVDPVYFEFAGDRVAVVLRGVEFLERGRRLPGMDLRLIYRVSTDEASSRLLLEKSTAVPPTTPDGEPKRLGIRGVAARRILENSLAINAPRILDLQRIVTKNVPLTLTINGSDHGWLTCAVRGGFTDDRLSDDPMTDDPMTDDQRKPPLETSRP
jgi:hypothetical protein